MDILELSNEKAIYLSPKRSNVSVSISNKSLAFEILLTMDITINTMVYIAISNVNIELNLYKGQQIDLIT